MSDELCETCAVGYYLPSGRCDHCDNKRSELAAVAGSALFLTMNITEKSLALCYAIEAAGASDALTKCSVLASELRTEIVAETERLARLSEGMKRFVAEYYPPDANGQVHFARALVEGYAQEIVAPEELNDRDEQRARPEKSS